MKIKLAIFATTTLILAAFALPIFQSAMAQAQHEMMMQGKDAIVRCAFDGMQMKALMMKATMKDKNGKTLYFCTKEQMEKFQKEPDKYLRQFSIGNVQVNLNILTVKDYMDAMKVMGMDKYMPQMERSVTHHISAYLIDERSGELIKDVGVQIELTTPGGEVQKKPLKFIEMMNYYADDFSFLKSAKYNIKVLLEAAKLDYTI
jgi:YHS domain-containing protein